MKCPVCYSRKLEDIDSYCYIDKSIENYINNNRNVIVKNCKDCNATFVLIEYEPMEGD